MFSEVLLCDGLTVIVYSVSPVELPGAFSENSPLILVLAPPTQRLSVSLNSSTQVNATLTWGAPPGPLPAILSSTVPRIFGCAKATVFDRT